VKTQLLVPFCFKGIGDEAVVRINLHVLPTRELCLVTQALDVLAAQGIGFGGRALIKVGIA
jgi:hypothetical protein